MVTLAELWFTNLVAVQSTHTTLHFRSADVANIVAFLVLYKDACE